MKINIIIYIIIFIILLLLFIIFKFFKKNSTISIDEKFLKMNSSFIKPVGDSFKNNKHNNICIITLETRKIDILSIHNENIKKYCAKHGYTYLFTDSYNNSLELPIYWKKLQIVKDNLPKYDYILWLDSDAIICHQEVPLEFLIAESPNSSIFIAKDHPSTKNETYCAGVFMIKNDYYGNKFINDCIETYLIRDECKKDGKMTLSGNYAGRCYEQGIMNELLDYYSFAMYHVKDSYIMNTKFPCYGTFILHYYDRDKDLGYHVFKKFVNTYIEMIPLTKVLYPNKICILLTLYTSDKNRNKLYNDNIKKWLETGFDVFSVDSSDTYRSIIHPNYKQFVFNQNIPFQKSNPSIVEKNSILKACEYFDNFKNYDLVFKITGKYFLPDFKDMLEYIPRNIDIVIQNNDSTHGQNCEIFGIKPFKTIEFLNLITDNHAMEQALYEMSQKEKEKTRRLRPLIPDKKVHRGDRRVLNYL